MKFKKTKSIIHKLDPRTKLIYLFLTVVFVIYSRNLFTLSILFLISISLFKISKLSFREFFSETKLLIFFLVLLFLFHFFTYTPLRALNTVLFLFDIFLLTSVFIQTTDPSKLTHSLVNWKIPYEFAFLFSLTLRFVPVLQNELEEVKSAQASRAHRLKYPWDAIPIIIPLLHKTFKRALDLSISLEAKAFSKNRTFYRKAALGTVDYLFLALLVPLILIFSV